MRTSAKIVTLLATVASAASVSEMQDRKMLAQAETHSHAETEYDVGTFGDTWFGWGMDGDVHFYYAYGETLYCYNEKQYIWDPSYWNVSGWNWYSASYIGDGACEYLLDDTWFSWGYDMNWYTANGNNYYATNGNVYKWDPSYWNHEGWTWYCTCYNSQELAQTETETEQVGTFGDTWFSWGMDGDVHFYYAYGETLYCYNEKQYIWNPGYWNVYGWNWYSASYIGDGACEYLLDDTWFSWGYDMNFYTANGNNYYAANGNVYKWNPSYWNHEGWTWYCTCYNSQELAQTEQGVGMFGDTWFSWGMDGDVHFYYSDGETLYCYNDSLYIWDPSFWNVYGWNWFAAAYYGDGACHDVLVDTFYSWGYHMDWYTANGNNYYCNNGTQYIYDPAAWNFYPGWTWVYSGSC